MPIGQLVMVISAVEAFRLALSNFFSNLGMQSQDSMFVNDTFRLMELEPTIKLPEKGFKLEPGAVPEIVFDRVTFKYPGTTKYVLNDFSLTIKPGERIALVGTTGAGKTTLVKLLCRFYDPTNGRILIGGKDLREIDLDSWYAVLGVLSQNFACYQLPVKDGISMGRGNVGMDFNRVKESAEEAEAARFVEALDLNYDTVVGPDTSNAVKLSNGEWQKLALARTFYRDARVMILDEPTAAVDGEAEARIFERLRKNPDRTTEILISHRFSTVRSVNRIVVLEDGAIKEVGTHDELMQRQGAYARLFELQAKGYGEQVSAKANVANATDDPAKSCTDAGRGEEPHSTTAEGSGQTPLEGEIVAPVVGQEAVEPPAEPSVETGPTESAPTDSDAVRPADDKGEPRSGDLPHQGMPGNENGEAAAPS
jgi:ATP-binding cassette subfamily B protein